jgi:hypothetical protein
MTRAAFILACVIGVAYVGRRSHSFIAGSGRRLLARADRMAEWASALLWAICFQEGSRRMDLQSQVVGDT